MWHTGAEVKGRIYMRRYLIDTRHMDTPKLFDLQILTLNSSVRTLGTVKKNYIEAWPIGMAGERESKESV